MPGDETPIRQPCLGFLKNDVPMPNAGPGRGVVGGDDLGAGAMTKINLMHPAANGGRQIGKLSFKSPTAAQIRCAADEMELLAFSAGTSPTIIKALSTKDFDAAQAVVSKLIG